MKIKTTPSHRLARLGATALLACTLSGCSSLSFLEPKEDPSRFYVLESSERTETSQSLNSDARVILLVASDVAKYLDRPQIVTSEAPNELAYSEFHRWSEPIADGTERILEKILSAELAQYRVINLRISPRAEWDYKMGYHISRMDGILDGEVHLEVTWWIEPKDGDTILHRSTLSASSATNAIGDSHMAFVRGLNEAVDAWALEVAAAFKNL